MITKETICKKIKEEAQVNENYAKYETERLYNNIFPEIEQNVEEWLADKPLSPIKIQGLSIDDIYEIWNQENFVDAVIALNKLRKDSP